MKKYMLILVLTHAVIVSAQQQMIVFQPGPGLNDGSDDGGAEAGMDTYSHGSDPATNWGASNYFVGTPVSNCNPAMAKQFVRFDLDTLPGSDEVDSVMFGVFHWPHTTYCLSNCDAYFYFYRVTQSWDEMALNWYTEPTWDTAAFYGPIHITFPNDFGNREYNITQAYEDWKNEVYPNYGFMIYSPTIGCNNASVSFLAGSSDDTAATKRPYLRVYYTPEDTSSAVHPADAGMNFRTNQSGQTWMFEASAGPDHGAVLLYDATGRLVTTASYSNHRGTVDISRMQTGMYFMKVLTQEGSSTKRVFIR
jgi:hypothetical protein